MIVASRAVHAVVSQCMQSYHSAGSVSGSTVLDCKLGVAAAEGYSTRKPAGLARTVSVAVAERAGCDRAAARAILDQVIPNQHSCELIEVALR